MGATEVWALVVAVALKMFTDLRSSQAQRAVMADLPERIAESVLAVARDISQHVEVVEATTDRIEDAVVLIRDEAIRAEALRNSERR